jgi:hypothetical protein
MTACLLILGISLGFEEVLPIPLETPPFESALLEDSELTVYAELELLETTPNAVTDYEAWFNGKDWPAVICHGGGSNDAIRGTIPRGVPSILTTPGDGEFHLSEIIFGTEADIALYGSPPNRFGVILNPRILVIMEPASPEGREMVLDFLAYSHSPDDLPVGEQFTFQQIRWAEVMDGILYVSTAHRTYAENSGGLNAYITALDLETLGILWRSEPLVANSENFLIIGDTIVSGYGFTNEDDYICLLDRLTGETLERIPVPSAPEYFYRDGDRLFVRCYDTDLVFNIH